LQATAVKTGRGASAVIRSLTRRGKFGGGCRVKVFPSRQRWQRHESTKATKVVTKKAKDIQNEMKPNARIRFVLNFVIFVPSCLCLCGILAMDAPRRGNLDPSSSEGGSSRKLFDK